MKLISWLQIGRRGVHGSAFFLMVLLVVSAWLAGCQSGEDAMQRGDRYWADSNYVAALAEYRLAARDERNTDALARVAHAYIHTGELDRAVKTYEKLLQFAPSFEDQAIFDYISVAKSDLQRGDSYGAARAAAAALRLRPGLSIPAMSLTLARHYATTGDVENAADYYSRSLNDVDPAMRQALLYEIAAWRERSGDCEAALPYFKEFSEQTESQDSATDARWRMGTCGLERGKQARAANEPEHALELLQITLDLGVPQNLLDQAWFERGEALMALNRRDEAEQAFMRVIEVTATPRGPLVGRAERRIQEIRGTLVP